MDDTPNYRFHRKPRFSANHLAEYLCTRDASQRDAVIRKAKFPRKPSVTAYQQVIPGFRSFLTKPGDGFTSLDALAERLKVKAETAEEAAKLEAKRCVGAIEAFKAAWTNAKWGKAQFLPGPQDVILKICDVAINVHLDPPMIEHGQGGEAFSGGCVMFLSNTPDGRKNIEDRRKYVAAVTHWALEGGNLPPAPRLCVSFDVFGNEVTRAPTSVTRIRKTMTDACREVFRKWDDIEPPTGYDGPDWH